MLIWIEGKTGIVKIKYRRIESERRETREEDLNRATEEEDE